jgi:hypothetical protein
MSVRKSLKNGLEIASAIGTISLMGIVGAGHRVRQELKHLYYHARGLEHDKIQGFFEGDNEYETPVKPIFRKYKRFD